jgi:multiple sugar transport system substrate-binding protein
LAFFAYLLSACSCSSGSELPTATTPDTENPAPEDLIDDDGRTKIRWFVGLGTGTDPAQVEIEQSVVDAFNETHDDIVLILEVVPYDSARDILSDQIDSGNAPDVIGPVGIGVSNFFYSHWMDLTPLIKGTNYDLSKFNEAVIELCQTEHGQVGLPFAAFPTALFYQKFMFDQAGLNYPPANIGDPYIWSDGSEAEWSWETLTQVAQLLTIDVHGLTPFEDGFDRDNIIQTGYHPQWSDPIVVGTFFDHAKPFEGVEGNYTANIPEAWKTAWQWWFEGMWGEAPFIANSVLAGNPEFGSGNIFNSQRTAMTQTQLWYTCCVGDAGDRWDLAAIPSYNGVVHGRMDADTFRISKDTPNPEAAFEVLTYLIGPDGTVPMMIGDEKHPGGAYSALPALIEYQDAFIDAMALKHDHVENLEVFLQGLNYPDIPNTGAWMPNMIEARTRITLFGNLIQSDGTIDFYAELELLENDLQAIFNK